MKNLKKLAIIVGLIAFGVTIVTVKSLLLSTYMLNPSVSSLPLFVVMVLSGLYLFADTECVFEERISKRRKVAVIIVLLLSTISFAYSTKYFQTEKLGNILVENNDIKMSDLIDGSEQRNITKEMAIQKAGKIMSAEVDGVQLSSQFELDVDNASIQLLNDKLVWVLPLDHKSILTWIKQDTTPGYVVVSASDPMAEAKLVKDRKMLYTSNAFYTKDINVINVLTSFFGIIKTHIEINEAGVPFYVALNIKPHGFLNGYITDSVQLINAETGERTGFVKISEFIKNKDYSWVDMLTEEEFVEESMNYKSLIYGLFNYIAIGENVIETTTYKNSELWVIKTTQGLKWFSGMTSTSRKDDSMVNAFYVDTRDSRSLVRIKTAGAMTENGAAIAVEGKLGADSVKWSPVLPTLIEIDGRLYWDMIVTNDSNGVFQKYARVDSTNQSLVTISDNSNFKQYKELSSSSELGEEMISISKKKYESIIQKIKEIEYLLNN